MRAIAQRHQPIRVLDAMQIVEPKCDRQAVVACKRALDAGAFAALLEQFDRVFAFNHFGLGGKSCPLPWLERDGPSFPALSSRAGTY